MLKRQDLGDNIPKRGGVITPPIASHFLSVGNGQLRAIFKRQKSRVFSVASYGDLLGRVWHSCIIALDLDVKVLGKQSLFKNFASKAFFNWVGVIPIDRANKGSVLKATIDKFNERTSLFLGLSPEKLRLCENEVSFITLLVRRRADCAYCDGLATREIRFMHKVEPTDNYEAIWRES